MWCCPCLVNQYSKQNISTKGNECAQCGASFASRNKLFVHLNVCKIENTGEIKSDEKKPEYLVD